MSRTVIIGDIHGCGAELGDLANRLALTSSDRVFLVGDLIGRGPSTLGVLRMARELGAVSVQGNHERRLLEVRHAAQPTSRRMRLGPSHRRLMDSLGSQDWAQLERMPLCLSLPEHDMLIVHAGIDPKLPLDSQDPWVLTHIRSIDTDGRPSHRPGHASWACSYQGSPHIVFGHHALASLQLHPHATGLDTGCVYGGRLTAMVLPKNARVLPIEERREMLVSVPARRRYFEIDG